MQKVLQLQQQVKDTSLRTAGLVAGLGLLITTLLAIPLEFFVFQRLIVPGNAALTAANIAANETLFRSGIAGWIVIFVLDMVVAWALYVLVKPVDSSLSLLTSLGRLVYATIGGASLLLLVVALELSTSASNFAGAVLPLVNAYSLGASIGLVFFGLHLLLLGWLVFKSGYIPRVVGGLLIAASIAYLVDNFGKLLLPRYGSTIVPALIFLPAFLGEFSLMVWLLWKGRRKLEAL